MVGSKGQIEDKSLVNVSGKLEASLKKARLLIMSYQLT